MTGSGLSRSTARPRAGSPTQSGSSNSRSGADICTPLFGELLRLDRAGVLERLVVEVAAGRISWLQARRLAYFVGVAHGR